MAAGVKTGGADSRDFAGEAACPNRMPVKLDRPQWEKVAVRRRLGQAGCEEGRCTGKRNAKTRVKKARAKAAVHAAKTSDPAETGGQNSATASRRRTAPARPASLPRRKKKAERSRGKKSSSTGPPIGMANQQGNFLNVIDVGQRQDLCAGGGDHRKRLALSRARRRGVARLAQGRDCRSGESGIVHSESSGSGGRYGGCARRARVGGRGGSHVRGLNTHGGITFGTRPREIAREEIRLAVDKARAIPLPADREILHLLPQEFILDEQAGVHDPLGMMAARLEVRVHMVTSASSATQNVVTAVNRAGVHVDDTVFEPLACADAVLRSDERDLGVCLADIGAGSTELAIFYQGAVAYTGVIPDRRRPLHQRSLRRDCARR